MAAYLVTIRPQFAAYNDLETVLEIAATTKAEAISIARKKNAREYFYDRHNGRITYTAQEAK